MPLAVGAVVLLSTSKARDKGYVNSCTAVLYVHVYVCVGGARALQKNPAHDVRESPALHEKSSWLHHVLYPIPWYEQECTNPAVVTR